MSWFYSFGLRDPVRDFVAVLEVPLLDGVGVDVRVGVDDLVDDLVDEGVRVDVLERDVVCDGVRDGVAVCEGGTA